MFGPALNWRDGGTSWTQDYPRADRHFALALRRLSRIHVRSVEQPVNLDEGNDVYNWPWLCAGEMGDWLLTDAQAKTLREIGCIERTVFTLDWIVDPALRRRSNAGLNKGAARSALSKTIFFHRHGEIRDRTFENQSYRASGLNLAVAAVVLWNTVYLSRAIAELRSHSEVIPDEILAHIAPLGCEHITFNGDYVWPRTPLKGGFPPSSEPTFVLPRCRLA